MDILFRSLFLLTGQDVPNTWRPSRFRPSRPIFLIKCSKMCTFYMDLLLFDKTTFVSEWTSLIQKLICINGIFSYEFAAFITTCACHYMETNTFNHNHAFTTPSLDKLKMSHHLSIYLPTMSNPCWGPRHMVNLFKF